MQPAQYNPADDGITHINVYSNGKTELGRKLSHFNHAPWDTADDRFDCFEGWWFWQLAGASGNQMSLFGTPDREKLRTMTGREAKKYGTEIVGPKRDWPDSVNLPWFQAKYKDAAKAKLQQHPDLAQQLETSSLPLVHYYVVAERNGEPIVNSDQRGHWIMEVWEDFRHKLQNNMPL